jgi:replication-associated recombination protein RarA
MHSLLPSCNDWKDGVLSRIDEKSQEIEEADNSLRCDRWIASSLLQKSIRRSNVQLALRAAFTLSAFDRSYTWRRLLIIAFEDVGAAETKRSDRDRGHRNDSEMASEARRTGEFGIRSNATG